MKITLKKQLGAVALLILLYQKIVYAVTVIGFVLLVAVGIGTMCLLAWAATKAIAAFARVQAAREAQMTNMVAESSFKPATDMFIDTPGIVWTPLTNAPEGWVIGEIPDEEFHRAMVEYCEWAIVGSREVTGPYRDTGARKWGNPLFIKNYLMMWVNEEGPVAPADAHLHVDISFYRAIPVEQLPPPEDPQR